MKDLPNLELVDVVDKGDRVIEVRTLDECLKQGLLHRAVTIFLRNSKGDIFLQQRSKTDDWLPGLWTASSTGHVKSGEDVTRAAERELEEELGIVCQPKFLFKFITPEIRLENKIEHELNTVFDASSDDSINFDPNEVEQGEFFEVNKCKEFFKVKSKEITLDARLAFERYRCIKEL